MRLSKETVGVEVEDDGSPRGRLEGVSLIVENGAMNEYTRKRANNRSISRSFRPTDQLARFPPSSERTPTSIQNRVSHLSIARTHRHREMRSAERPPSVTDGATNAYESASNPTADPDCRHTISRAVLVHETSTGGGRFARPASKLPDDGFPGVLRVGCLTQIV